MRVVVLGAGLAGLTAARAVPGSILIESAPAVGGLTRSLLLDQHSFDYTGHFLHLSRGERRPSGLPLAGLRDEDWQEHQRVALAWLDGELVPAPVQYQLERLDPAYRESYRERPDGPVDTLRDYLENGFGRRLTERFLAPLNQKTLGLPPEQLHPSAATRFFPHPKPRAAYNATFWYPRLGGIEALVHGLARGVGEVRLGERALALELELRRVVTTRGSYRYDRLFSSLPLNRLCALSDDPELREWGATLSHSSTLCVNLAVEGEVCPALRGAHWVYVADPEVEFYRLGFYSHVQPSGDIRLFAEIGGLPEAVVHWAERDPVGTVMRRLRELGWVRGRVRAAAVFPIPCAYVHFTSARESALTAVFERLGQAGVCPIGRYGRWDHLSMEDCLYSTLELVAEAIRAVP